MKSLTCVKCGQAAITTAAQIPVCAPHFDEYAKEGRQYLPPAKRPVYQELIRRYEQQTGKDYFIRT